MPAYTISSKVWVSGANLLVLTILFQHLSSGLIASLFLGAFLAAIGMLIEIKIVNPSVVRCRFGIFFFFVLILTFFSIAKFIKLFDLKGFEFFTGMVFLALAFSYYYLIEKCSGDDKRNGSSRDRVGKY